MDFRIEQDVDDGVIQLSFAESSSIYAPCFSPNEFSYFKECMNNLEKGMGKLCPDHADADCDRKKAGLLSAMSVDHDFYELQFVDKRVWSQVQFTKKEWEQFKKRINDFKLMGCAQKEKGEK